MIILTAVFEAATGKEETLEKMLADLIPQTAGEEGTLEYRLHRSTDDAGRFLFYEKFRDQEALDHHMKQPHVTALFASLDALLTQPPVVTFYEFVGGVPEK